MKAISAILSEAGKKSLQYYEQLFSLNKNIILGQAKSDEEMQVVGCAITCMSNLVYSMEDELQKTALNSLGEINQRIMYLLKTEFDLINPEMKEAIYEWLSTLVQIVHEEFTIIEEVIPYVFRSAEIDDIIINDDDKDDENELMKQDDEDEKYKGMNVRTNSLDEKAAALHMIGVFAEYLPFTFYQYKEKVITLLKDNCNG